jgi:hypothetical protein
MKPFLLRTLVAASVIAALGVTALTGSAAAVAPGPCDVSGVWQGVSTSQRTGMTTSVQLIIQQRGNGHQFDWIALDEGGIPLFSGHGDISSSDHSAIMGTTPDGSAIVHAHGVVTCAADTGVTATFEYTVNSTGNGVVPAVQDQGTVQLVHGVTGGRG